MDHVFHFGGYFGHLGHFALPTMERGCRDRGMVAGMAMPLKRSASTDQ
jgi:hypothetical protein